MSPPEPLETRVPLRLLFVGADVALAARLAAGCVGAATLEAVDSAAAALERAAATAFDAALVQPRLAQGSGNALLGALKREHPAVVRCLLLDDGRDAPALAALENLHRVLQQPLDPAALVEDLQALLALRRRLGRPALAEAIGRVGRLPPPPRLSLELLRRTEDGETSAREVAALVESDPALAAKVLRLCNSAMYAGQRRIEDIHSAVVRLGNLALRRLVLAGEIFGTGRTRAEDPAQEALRERSLRASRLAARLLPGPRADLAATAALLAGVGRLLPEVRLPWLPAAAAEADWPGYDEAGAYLLALWGLPEPLVEATARHVHPGAAGESGLGLVGACHLAWALAGDVPLDGGWLAAQGLEGELEAWRALAADASDAG